jgi:hypothetical protein
MSILKKHVSHILSGIDGWSFLFIRIIDVNKVINIKYYKRLFCVFENEYKYTLKITYDEPFNYSSIFLPTSKLTKRYKTEMECQNEIFLIEYKKKTQI